MRLALVLAALLALSGCGSWNHHANDLYRIPNLSQEASK